MLSLNAITVPVVLDTTVQAQQLLQQWTRMYHYGHQVLPTMAVGTFLLYSYAASKKKNKSWGAFALAGIATVSMVPFTWLVMVPTNNELFRLELASRTNPAVIETAKAVELVVKWNQMHFTRALMPLVGAFLGALGVSATP